MREWRLVIWLSVAQMISWGTLFYGFAVIVGPMERELGWPKTEIYGALSVGLAVAGLAALPVGAWMDRHGGLLSMTAGSAIGGLLMIAWAFVETPVQLYVIWIGMGVVLACVLYEPGFAVVAANVRDWKRGILVMTFLGGLASTLFIPLGHYLTDQFDWRTTLIVMGGFNLIVGVAIHLYWLRGTRAKGEAALKADQNASGSALGAAMRRPAFWGLGFAYFAYNFAVGSVTFHLISLLGERNVDPDAIVIVWATIGPMQVAGRMALFLVGAPIDGRLIGRVAMTALVVGVALLASGVDTLLALLAFACIYGAGNGLMTIVKGTLASDIFGPRAYATVNGALSVPYHFARALAPVAAAALWGFVGYDGVLLILLGLLVAGLAAIWAVTSARAAS
jgi:MFS family permease